MNCDDYDLLCRIYDRYVKLNDDLKNNPIDPRDYRDKDEDEEILAELKSLVEI